MKFSNFLRFFLLAIVLLFSQLTYADPTNIDDVAIMRNIKSKLSTNKITSNLNIGVQSKAGVVTLIGKLNTKVEISKAIELAQSIPGVTDVDAEKLMLRNSNQPLKDTIITAKVKGSFIREKLFGSEDIDMIGVKVKTTNGTVYLTGKVDSKRQADNAVELAESIKGVKSVDSKLEVKPAS